eukprot:566993-Amphidinium_carterae.1
MERLSLLFCSTQLAWHVPVVKVCQTFASAAFSRRCRAGRIAAFIPTCVLWCHVEVGLFKEVPPPISDQQPNRPKCALDTLLLVCNDLPFQISSQQQGCLKYPAYMFFLPT